MELSKMIMEANPSLPCFANNYFIAFVLNSNGKSIPPKSKSDQKDNPFIEYNLSVITEEELSHNYKKTPSLKSKLLFMDFQFNTLKENTSLSHSSAQNPRLVQVFLNSHLCLLHFANFISNSENIFFRSVVKRCY
jgi:hypothetical protein